MKHLYFISIFLFPGLLLFVHLCAQPTGPADSTIELRFRLIEKKSNGNLALDVQVINHSVRPLYIPGPNYLTFHLYVQSDSGWDELGLYTHSHPPKGKPAFEHVDVRGFDNDLTRQYNDSAQRYYASQKAIFDSLRRIDTAAAKWAEFSTPLFLKAGEQLHYRIFPMDHIKRPGENYKISYATEDRDARVIEGAKERAMQLPEHILEYTRFIPPTILSNTIYYSTTD